MSEQEAPTPYAEATALKNAGADPETIATRLRGRGLDEEAIALLLSAIGSRVLTGPLPTSAAAVEPVALAADPKVPALGPPPTTVCTRCGVFLEAWVPVLGKAYCPACAARPDVNYPRAYRDAYWGKRDSWAWFMGITGLLGLALGAIAMIQSPGLGLMVVVGSIGSILFWSGAQLGRPALVASTVIGVVLGLANGGVPNLAAIGLTVAALRSVRTKLFFQIEVSEAELEAAWRAEHDNRTAAYSQALGFIALATILTWLGPREFAFGTVVLGALAVLTGIIGVRNVKPDAHPPVGRKGAAITGLVTGGLAVVSAAVFLVWSYR